MHYGIISFIIVFGIIDVCILYCLCKRSFNNYNQYLANKYSSSIAMLDILERMKEKHTKQLENNTDLEKNNKNDTNLTKNEIDLENQTIDKSIIDIKE